MDCDCVHCRRKCEDLPSSDQYAEDLLSVTAKWSSGVSHPVHASKELAPEPASHDTSNIGNTVYLWVTTLEQSDDRVGPCRDETRCDDEDNAGNHADGVEGGGQSEDSDTDLEVDEKARSFKPDRQHFRHLPHISYHTIVSAEQQPK